MHAQYPLHHVTYTPAQFEATTSNSLGEDRWNWTDARSHDLNVAQYPLHHVTNALAKFEVALSNGLGDAFTRKYIIQTWALRSRSLETLPSTLYIM